VIAGLLLATGLAGALAARADDVVVEATRGPAVTASADFAEAVSPNVQGGAYLRAPAAEGGTPEGVIRVAAPAGRYYVYVAWARHPQGARDVLVRLGDVQVRVDESRLANGGVPEDLTLDDMPGFDGVCSSGLCRLTDEPVALDGTEHLEVVRSDTTLGTVTTLDYVVFSPCLYLDDLGSDARLTGPVTVNLKDYGAHASGNVGFGLAFLPKGVAEASVEWTVPADGLFLVEADANRGQSRAVTMPLQVTLPDGTAATWALAGKLPVFGRGEWQTLGALAARRGTKLQLGTAADGYTCCDLLRLTPVDEAALSPAGEGTAQTFIVQWEEAARGRPWLRQVRVVPVGEGAAQVAPLARPEEGWQGVQVRMPEGRLPVLGLPGDRGLPVPAEGAVRVELAEDYGFTLSAALLRQHPLVWLRDLGVCAVAGDGATRQAQTEAMAAVVRRASRQPFRSTAEQYSAFTGYSEDRWGQDDRAFEFAYLPDRPLAPRVSAAISAMPEADYGYFLSRVAEPRHRRMFLGWPNVCQEFYVLSNGCLGVSSASGQGTGHPPAEAFTVAFGAGDPASFREHGDPTVKQSIEDGYQLIAHTRWDEAGARLECTAFAYPLAGEEVRTGSEPLGAFVRYASRGRGGTPLWLRIRPDEWGGPDLPLQGLGAARVANGLLLAGDRVVLGVLRGSAAIAAAADGELLVRLNPSDGRVDLAVPYIAVEPALVQQAQQLGFDGARQRMRRYWDARLAQGAKVEVPEAIVNDQYRTLYPRTLMCGDLDTQGDYALKTSPIIYEAVWLHATAYGIEGLARRGHFAEAKQYLEAAFHWQGSQPSDAPGAYTTWDGFFNAPPRYTAALWLNFHGWMQWAAARYFLFSDDQAYLAEKLPALVKSLEWTASQRRLTMNPNADGSRPPNYGWLPPGRVTDGSAGTSTFTDCINWMGCNEVVRLLERIGHPRAAEFRREADDYRACILRGLRLAAREREPVRLNDGTFVPYVPGYLESQGHEENMWYAAVVDGALEGILDSGVVPPGDPLEDWVLANLEDNLFVIAPNLADEAYFLGHGCGYLRRDEPAQAIYTLHSVLASHMARDTRTTFEHRSWGANRVYELTPWPMGYYTRMLAGMLCYDEGTDLTCCRATPRAWLAPGRTIRVERLQTRFGPTSFTLTGEPQGVRGTIDLPRRYPPAAAYLRLRVAGEVTEVRLNGQRARPDGDTVRLPAGGGRVRVEAEVQRGSLRP